MRTIALMLAALMAMAMPVPAWAGDVADGPMTQEKYAAYLQLFNAGDERYADFYDEDVVFYHDPMFGVLRGRQAILDFYRTIRTQLREHVTAHIVVIDREQGVMAAELTTRLVAVKDGIEMPSGTINTGDTIISEGTVYYTLRNGRIATIRGGISGGRKLPAGAAEQ